MWNIHILAANGLFNHWEERLRQEIENARATLDERLRSDCMLQPVDIVLDATSFGTIPEYGIGGSCFRKDRIDICLDTDNPNFLPSIDAGQLRRTLYHEFHHALRWGQVGYGLTLGEALVSEGLAEHFDCEISGDEHQFWTQRLSIGEIGTVKECAKLELDSQNYDHSRWFFGSATQAATLPKWAGYALGCEIVGRYLNANPQVSAFDLIARPAKDILTYYFP